MLKFHWRLLQGGETAGISRAAAALQRETAEPALSAQLEFCRLAEDLGITGLLVDIGAAKPDPIVLSGALGLDTRSIEFITACRSGLQSPAGLAKTGLDDIFLESKYCCAFGLSN